MLAVVAIVVAVVVAIVGAIESAIHMTLSTWETEVNVIEIIPGSVMSDNDERWRWAMTTAVIVQENDETTCTLARPGQNS